MAKLIISVFFLLAFGAVRGQLDSLPLPNNWKSVSAQFLGTMGYGGVRFDNSILKSKNWYYSVGLGYYSDGDRYVSLPLSLGHLFFFSNKRSAIDLSVTANPMILYKKVFEDKPVFFNFFPGIAYKKFSTEKVVYSFQFTPLINEFNRFMPYGGFSIGYHF